MIEYLHWLYDARRDIICKANTEYLISKNRLILSCTNKQNTDKWLKKVDAEIQRVYELLQV